MGAAEIFRGSPYARGWSLHDVERIARRAAGEGVAERAEFISLIEKAETIFEPVATRCGPVAIPIDTGLHQALDEYFLRYGWSWFPAVDEHGRYAGIVTQERTQASIDSGEGWLTIASVVSSSIG